MCGLFGSISNTLDAEAVKNTFNLGILSQFRGRDSTGIGTISVNKGKREGKVYKRMIPSGVFFNSDELTKPIREVEGLTTLIGHTRLATAGGVTKENTQPIVQKGIIGTHNGTCDAFSSKNDDRSDSVKLYEMLAESSIKDVLDKANTRYNSAYALAWTNVTDGTMNLIRNADRTLWLVSTGAVDYWISNVRFIELLESMSPFVIKNKILLEHDVLYTRHKDSMEWVKTKIKVTKNYSFRSSSSNTDNWYDNLPWYLDPKYNVALSKKERKRRKKQAKAAFNTTDNSSKSSNVIILPGRKTETNKKDDPLSIYCGWNNIQYKLGEINLKLEKSGGCYCCQVVPLASDKIFWKNHQEYLCEKCYYDPWLREYENKTLYDFQKQFTLGYLKEAV